MGFWTSRVTLVTGATGLMGGWLVKRLLDQGADVVALVRDRVPAGMLASEGGLDRCTVVNGSLSDFGLLRRALCEYSVDTVFHLAAQPIVGVAKLDPLGTLEANVQGTWNVLEAGRLAGVKQMIVASSDKAYGDSKVLPYTELHPLEGRFPYDVSKSCADLISTMYATTYQLPVVVVRCANLFGPGDLNFNRLIPGVIRSTLHGESFVIRSDGSFIRSFVYVKDAALGYMSAAQRLAESRSMIGEAFNLTLETKMTVLEISRKVLQLMGRNDLEPVILNQTSGEIRDQYMSSEKAEHMLGWRPTYTFEEGLRETIGWYQTLFGTPELKSVSVSA
jgi:CDP-glucose 4,6-dehydratase